MKDPVTQIKFVYVCTCCFATTLVNNQSNKLKAPVTETVFCHNCGKKTAEYDSLDDAYDY